MSINPARTVRKLVSLPVALGDRIATLAAEEGISESALMRRLIERGLSIAETPDDILARLTARGAKGLTDAFDAAMTLREHPLFDQVSLSSDGVRVWLLGNIIIEATRPGYIWTMRRADESEIERDLTAKLAVAKAPKRTKRQNQE